MQIFKSVNDIEAYSKEAPLSSNITQQINTAIEQIRELRQSSFQEMKACVVLIETKEDSKKAISTFGIGAETLEAEEEIRDDYGAVWKKQIHILDDTGDGVIVFQKPDSCL